MEKVKISFLDLVNVLSEQEMKKVTGGCGGNRKMCCFSDGECVYEYTCTSDADCKKHWGEGWCI